MQARLDRSIRGRAGAGLLGLGAALGAGCTGSGTAALDAPAPGATVAAVDPLGGPPAGGPGPAGGPLPPGVACRVDGVDYTHAQYFDYVRTVFQRRWLDDFVDQCLLEQAAAELGLVPTDREVAAGAEEGLREMLATRYGGDPERFASDLESQGHDRATFRELFELNVRRQLMLERVARATRVVDEDRIRFVFQREYGIRGVQVEVRHIQLLRAREKLELRRKGATLDELEPDAIEARLVERAERILAEHAAGARFEDLVRLYSHETSAHRTLGRIDGNDFVKHGPVFTDAVLEAPVGELLGPILTPTSVHLFEVTSRVETDLEDVRAEIEELARTEPPSAPEIVELEERLRSAAEVATY